jgi:hypothetical protein
MDTTLQRWDDLPYTDAYPSPAQLVQAASMIAAEMTAARDDAVPEGPLVPVDIPHELRIEPLAARTSAWLEADVNGMNAAALDAAIASAKAAVEFRLADLARARGASAAAVRIGALRQEAAAASHRAVREYTASAGKAAARAQHINAERCTLQCRTARTVRTLEAQSQESRRLRTHTAQALLKARFAGYK